MIIRRLILLIFVCIGMSSAYGNDVPNIESKVIKKTLSKYGIEELSSFKEITVDGDSKSEIGTFFTSYPQDTNSSIKYLYIGRVSSCRAGICSTHEDVSEYFDYIILFNKDKSVFLVKVINYQATHGQEITAKSWLKQFIGFTGDKKLEVNKNIDSISGATISTYAITEDINKQVSILSGL